MESNVYNDILPSCYSPGDVVEARNGKSVYLMDTPGNRFGFCRRKMISTLSCEATILKVYCFISEHGKPKIQYLVECGTETGWVDSFEVRLKHR